jgi:hypothetical protein
MFGLPWEYLLDNKQGGWNMKTTSVVTVALLFVLSAACGQSQGTFNTTDKSAKTNGNFDVAMKKLNRAYAGQEPRPEAVEISMQELSMSPHASIGKFIRVLCYPYKTEKVPPNDSIGNNWFEILALADNPNAILKVTSLDIFLKNERLTLKPNTPEEITGYFIGTHDTINAMGGPVEAYVFVANSFHQE